MNKNTIDCFDDLLKRMQINGIALHDCTFERFDPDGLEGTVEIQVGFSSEGATYEQEDESVLIIQPVMFEMKTEFDGETNQIFDLKANYMIDYTVKGELTQELFEEYSKNHLPRIVHPYVRELVTSMLTRAGMPPFTIPLFESA